MNNYGEAPEGYKYIFVKCVTINGKTRCAKKGKFLRFLVKISK